MVDAAHARLLRNRWDDFDLDTRLRVVDCPDRRLNRAAQVLVAKARNEHPHTNVTVLLPRRTYAPLLGRLLHDRTADKIARAVSRVPDAAATIVPYDVQSRIREAFPDTVEQRIAREVERLEVRIMHGEDRPADHYEHPERPATVISVDSVIPGRRATVEGRVNQVEEITKRGQTFRSIVVGDESGEIRITFRPGRCGDEVAPGQMLRITGKVQQSGTREASMLDPDYQVIEVPAEES
jgi:OB-fold nucleic acid binding domain